MPWMSKDVTPQRGRRWASYRTAAEYVGVTAETIGNMVADGRLTAYRCGPRIVRVDLDELDAAMVPSSGDAALESSC
jgi:excisionase family DNA binding protein